MSSDNAINVIIDASGSQQGADQHGRAVDQIVSKSAEGGQAVTNLEGKISSLGATAQVAAGGMATVAEASGQVAQGLAAVTAPAAALDTITQGLKSGMYELSGTGKELRVTLSAVGNAMRDKAQAEMEAALAAQKAMAAIAAETAQLQGQAAAARLGIAALREYNLQQQINAKTAIVGGASPAVAAAGGAPAAAAASNVSSAEAGLIASNLRVQAAFTQEVKATEAAAASANTQFDYMGRILLRLTIYALVAEMANLIKQSVELGVEFQSSLVKLSTLAGVPVEELKGIGAAIQAQAAEVGVSANEEAKAMFAVSSEGLRGQAAMDALAASAKASALGLGDQTTIARTAVAAMQAYSASGLTATQATSLLIAAAREGNVPVDTLAGSLGKVTAIAAAVGVSFDQLLANIATFTRLGVSASVAATGLRSVLQALELKPSAGAVQELQAYGTSIQQIKKDITDNGLAQALVDLVAKFNGNNEALAKIFPNIRALADELSNAKSSGTAYLGIQERISADMNTGLDNAWRTFVEQDPKHVFDLMKASAENAAISIEQGMIPALTEIAAGMTAAFSADPGGLRNFGAEVGTVLKGLADAVLFLTNNAWLMKAAFDAWIALKIAGFVTSLVQGLTTAVLAQRAAAAAADAQAVSLGYVDAAAMKAVTSQVAIAGATAAEVTVTDLATAAWARFNAALAKNAFGLIILGLAAVYEGLSKLISMWAAESQAEINAIAKENEQAQALAALRSGYDLLAGGIVKLNDNAFPAKLAQINTYFDLQKLALAGNKQGLADLEKQRQTSIKTLEDETKALLDNREALLKEQEATLIDIVSQRGLAEQKLRTLKQQGAPPPSTALFGEGAVVASQDAYQKSLEAAQAQVDALANREKTLGTSLNNAEVALDQERQAVDQSIASHAKLGAAVPTAQLDAFGKAIAKLKQGVIDHIAENNLMITGITAGGVAEEEATRKLEGLKLVHQATDIAISHQKVVTDDLRTALMNLGAALVSSGENLKVAQGNQKDWEKQSQESVATLKQIADQQALLDARRAGASKNALKDLAEQEKNENTAMSEGFVLGSKQFDQRVKQLGQLTDLKDAGKVLDDQETARNKAGEQLEAWQGRMAKLEAQRIDILTGTTDATRKLTAAEELNRQVKLLGTTATADQIAQLTKQIQQEVDAADQLKKADALVKPMHDMTTALENDFNKVIDDIATRTKITWDDIWKTFEADALKAILKTAEVWAAQQFQVAVSGQGGQGLDWGSLFKAFGFGGSGGPGNSAATGSFTSYPGDPLAGGGTNQPGVQAPSSGGSLGGLGTSFGVGSVAGGAIAGAAGGNAAQQKDASIAGGLALAGAYAFTIPVYGWIAGIILEIGSAIAAIVAALAGTTDWAKADIAIAQGTTYVAQMRGTAQDIQRLGPIGNAIGLGVKAIMDSLGAFSTQTSGIFETIARSGHGDKTDYTVNVAGMVHDFQNNFQAAMEFATIQALKQSHPQGLSAEVTAAIQNTQATTLDQLQSDIQFAQKVHDMGLGQIAQDVEHDFQDFTANIQRANALKIPVEALFIGLKDQITSMRDQILGIQKDPKQTLDDNIKQFNDGIKQQIAAMQQQDANAIADARTAITNAQTAVNNLKASQGMMNAAKVQDDSAAGDLAAAQQNLAAANGQLTAAQSQQQQNADFLKWLQGQLITPAEQAQAERKLPRTGSTDTTLKNAADTLKQALEALAEFPMDAYQKALDAINVKYDDAIKAAGKNKKAIEDLNKAREAEIKLLNEQTLATIATNIQKYIEEAHGLSSWGQQFKTLGDQFAQYLKDAIAAGAGPALQKRIKDAQAQADKDLGQQAIASLGLTTENTIAQFKTLTDTLNFLNQNAAALGLTTQQVAAMTAELGTQMFVTLATTLAGYTKNAADQQALAQISWDLQIANWELQIQLLTAAGLLTQAQIDFLNHEISQLPAIAPGATTTAATSGVSNLANAAQSAADALNQFIASLKTDSALSPLTPQQKLDAAQATYQKDLAGAAAGDSTALQNLPNDAKAYLAAAQAFYGSSIQYVDIFNAVLAQLQALSAQIAAAGGNFGGGDGPPPGYVEAWGPGGATEMVPPGMNLAAGWSYTRPPGFAEGGLITHRGLYMGGEAGPEAIIPLNKPLQVNVYNPPDAGSAAVVVELKAFRAQQRTEAARNDAGLAAVHAEQQKLGRSLSASAAQRVAGRTARP